jgi:hypothetical protein
MRWRLINSVALLLCIFILPGLPGQHSTTQSQNRLYKRRFYRLLRVMDSNQDQKLSRTEWRGQATFFNQLDSNGDGYITEQEFCNRVPIEYPEPTIPEIDDEQESLVIHTRPLIMTGKRFISREIRTQRLIMTGKRVTPILIKTDQLVMTGKRFGSVLIKTDRLIMTGKRVIPIEIKTDRLVMTGKRFGSVRIQTDRLIMTGNRE